MLIAEQNYNPLTGDTALDPAAFGLSVADIPNDNLRTLVTSGRVTLTSEEFREMARIAESKFGKILPSDIDQNTKDSGLYMTNEYIGFWDLPNTQWRAVISNDGSAFFGDKTLDNYMEWDSQLGVLEIRGDIEATSITADVLNGIEINGSQVTAGTIDTERLNIGYLETVNMVTLSDDPGWVPPLNGIVIDESGIAGFNNGVLSFGLNTVTGDATFAGTIKASNIDGTVTVPGGSKMLFNDGGSESIEILTVAGDRPRIRLSDDGGSRDLYYDYDSVSGGTSRMAINTNLVIKGDLISGATDKVGVAMQHFSGAAAGFLYADAANDLYWLPSGGVAVKLN